MAKREVVQTDLLEEVEIEIRDPSVVMSVRLDSDTARAVMGLARSKGRKVSDILREAAVAYAAAGGEIDTLTVELQGARMRVRMGTWNATTSARGLSEGTGEQSFGVALRDTRVLTGIP